MIPYYDSWAWPLRTGLACALASLVYLSSVDENGQGVIEARIVAPLVASISSSLLLGQTIRVGWLLMRGAIIGGILGSALVSLIQGLGWMIPGVIYLLQAVVSVALLYYPMPSLQHKLAWALMTVGTAFLLEYGEVLDPA
jgi:hypothetical protein